MFIIIIIIVIIIVIIIIIIITIVILIDLFLGAPVIIRGDRGTENLNVAALQIFLSNRHNGFLFGRSTSNQVIFCVNFLIKFF